MFLAYFFWHFNFVNINSHIGYKTLVCEFVPFVPFPIGVGNKKNNPERNIQSGV